MSKGNKNKYVIFLKKNDKTKTYTNIIGERKKKKHERKEEKKVKKKTLPIMKIYSNKIK